MDPSGHLLPDSNGFSAFECKFNLVSALLYPITESALETQFIDRDVVESVWSAAEKCGWQIVEHENSESIADTFSTDLALPVTGSYLN